MTARTIVLCDVEPSFGTRFTIETHNNHCYVGCAIHGSGGAYRGEKSLPHVLLRLNRQVPSDTRDYFVIYTMEANHQRIIRRVPIDNIKSIQLFEEQEEKAWSESKWKARAERAEHLLRSFVRHSTDELKPSPTLPIPIKLKEEILSWWTEDALRAHQRRVKEKA